jgi:hypothetical protein
MTEPGDDNRDKQASLDLVQAIDTLGQLIEEKEEVLAEQAGHAGLPPVAADSAAPPEVPLLVDVVRQAHDPAPSAAGANDIDDLFADGGESDVELPAYDAETLRQELIADLSALMESTFARLRQDVERIVRNRFDTDAGGDDADPD